MTRISMIAIAATSCAIALALGQPTMTSRAAGTPTPPTPVVSVTTLPALPSPGVGTAHPVTPAPLPPTPGPAMGSPPAHPLPALTPALPPPGTFILIDGMVAKPAYITLDQLQHLRSTSITLKMSGHGILTVTGASLADVINLAQPGVTGGTNTSSSAYALFTGVSGQQAVVAFPEFEKAFEGKIILLAYLINGKPPKAGAATLVVQGDATAGRLVEGVTHIAIAQPSTSP
jgi:DMSO/TMAO reductase YedYZ molybdopterin-dependent catalytic subunit